MEEQLKQIFIDCANPDTTIRTQAEANVNNFKASDYPAFLSTCAQILGNPQTADLPRSMAGLVLKNALTCKDSTERSNLYAKWSSVQPEIRQNIKNLTLAAVASPSPAASGPAAQVVAYIAAVELPTGQWQDLIKNLISMLQPQSPDGQKKATLEALGYICEEVDSSGLKPHSNSILTAVCSGISQNQNPEVVYAGCRALFNTLEFIQSNFQRDSERDTIMGILCTAANSPHIRARTAAMECLVQIATLYYRYLPPYMQTLFGLTVNAIKQDEEPMALQSIEFWSTICDEEADCDYDQYDKRESHHFIRGALPHLVPVLNECLTKQEDEPEDDAWTVVSAAATCLSLITATVEDEIIPFVMGFVNQNINSTNWKLMEAATLAFGSILEANKDKLRDIIIQALPVLLSHMSSQQASVRDTTAWTIGRVCQLHGEIATSGIQHLVGGLGNSLNDAPRVASNVCYAIHYLLEQYVEKAQQPTNPVSPYYSALLGQLFNVIAREDGSQSNLRVSAYETITVLISAGADDTLPTLHQAIPHFIASFASALGSGSSEEKIELQTLLCGVSQAIIRRLPPQALQAPVAGTQSPPLIDRFMELFLSIPSSHSKPTPAHEDALLSIACVVTTIEGEFVKYLNHVMPFLLAGLSAAEDTAFCQTAVGLVGDISRAVGKNFAGHEQVVTIFVQNLQNSAINKDVKPAIICAFGDIALAIGADFERYIPTVMNMLRQAGQTTVDPLNDDQVEYLNQLRESICEAFTGLIIGLREGNGNLQVFFPHIEWIVQFITFVWRDPTRSDALNKGLIGMVGDVLSTFGKNTPSIFFPELKAIATECSKMEDADIKQIAMWCLDMLKKYGA
ncbi:hypothetical protein PROFUN_00995 [Planoprotostelium fungivorum]|uniref:Importin N-terminal domain-containing protein n=1 Tax=Planoprotostelium fungivorum TaxID=1890364 RepID=A0A2P6N4G3_9EUKA|nr:hypothetical protein PROFUN_00995 [Planoprotostelium fungivorum]